MAESSESIIIGSNGKPYKRTRRSNDFACILYPDFDETHKSIFEYICSLPSPLFVGYAWIKHDKDLVEPTTVSTPEGDEHLYTDEEGTKKEHIHMYFKLCKASTVAGIRNHFDNKIYLQVVDCPEAYLLYLLHRDWKSLQDSTKHKYDYEELNLTENFTKLIFQQKGNFVSNFDYIYTRLLNGIKIYDVFLEARQFMSNLEFEQLLKDFRLYQYLFIHIEESQEKKFKRLQYRTPLKD